VVSEASASYREDVMSAPPRRRLTRTAARERAARACGVDVGALDDGTEHDWGWSFELTDPRDGSSRAFVDAATGLTATGEPADEERLALLAARGPLGVPPWSPPPRRTWWQALRSALGIAKSRP
jgi:hypothetical protein